MTRALLSGCFGDLAFGDGTMFFLLALFRLPGFDFWLLKAFMKSSAS
jgi:hypothetical protein